MKKVFISGKITGENINRCFLKFNNTANYLYGYYSPTECFIINPLKLDGIYFGISHKEAMEICLKELKTCTHIYMLKDWMQSDGAIQEHQFALENNIKIIYQ